MSSLLSCSSVSRHLWTFGGARLSDRADLDEFLVGWSNCCRSFPRAATAETGRIPLLTATMPDKTELSYEVLLEVTNVLNSQRDTESLWRAIAGQIRQVVPWERAGLTLYDPKLDGFRFCAVVTDLPRPVLQPDSVIPRKGSAVGWVYEHRRVHIRPNLHRERIFLEDEDYLKEGLGRMINLPLLVRGTCLGTLNIGSVQTGEPDPQDVRFLQHVATQVAFAIEQVRAYEQIKRLSEQLAQQNEYLVDEVKRSQGLGPIIGESPAFAQVLNLVRAVAPTDTTVLLTGETGTGKDVVARAIHDLSPRRDKPFIRVNCAALPAGLIESELFGHERGAFTGADQRRPGRFELADGGTLFLDEIGEMPLEAQAKLLRVLQDQLVDRVGGTRSIPVNVRIIAATNANLMDAIVKGTFRADLFYRLNVFPIPIPPLRERPEDIPLLARHFLAECSQRFRRPDLTIEPRSMERLVRYHWTGNVRELKNVIERAVILCRSSTVEIDERLLPSVGQLSQTTSPSTMEEVERHHILKVLERTNGRIYGPQGAAEVLGMNPSTLRGRMRKLGITRPRRAKAGKQDGQPV